MMTHGRGQILTHSGRTPRVHDSVYLACGSYVIGDVEIGEDSSIWFQTVVRGDVHFIRIGRATNLQDGSVCHVTTAEHALILGDEVTVGHMAMLHGCTVEDGCLIGIGSILLDEVVVGTESFVAAGSLVTPRTRIPPRSFVLGSPAKVLRELTPEEVARNRRSAHHYVELARSHRDGTRFG